MGAEAVNTNKARVMASTADVIKLDNGLLSRLGQ